MGDKVVKEIAVTNNVQRHCVLDFDKISCNGIKICFNSTNGLDEIRLFEARAY